ncbi:MAG: YifB family Mg chelatase-like AAA ATPase [Clostridia bacterium]|nr:YifB family Mg chelatase-like AAA ATPase [Clostridia bacterium]
MLSKVNSFSLDGLIGYKVDIEIDINAGLPKVEIIGLPDTAIKESAERVTSSIKNSGYHFPVKRVIVNLAPADTKKEGSLFDLPIAVGVLVASGQVFSSTYKDYVILGELSLDGVLRPINGLIAILISGLQQGYKKFIIPAENAAEASYIQGIEAYCAHTLKEVCEFLGGESDLQPVQYRTFSEAMKEERYDLDFSDVKGQRTAKRAMEIAVAGGHNILLIGPPGAGKSMLAKCVTGIMPDLTFEEAIEVTKVYSIAGLLDEKKGIVTQRPFRTPHHTATIPALVGGGNKAKPGEVSLANAGVLFLDEVPEYKRQALETLRQPLEDGEITVTRVQQTVKYPANFMLIGSMNPCPCGNFGSKKQICTCTPQAIRRYLNRLSGPLLDRIDIQVEVDSVEFADLRSPAEEETSAVVKERVMRAREIQRERFQKKPIFTNSDMNNRLIKQYCKIPVEAEDMMETAFRKLALSARASFRILKVARTIADLEGKKDIETAHVAEAIQYRSLDRKYFS